MSATLVPAFHTPHLTQIHNEGKYLLEWVLYHYLIGFQVGMCSPPHDFF